MYPVRYTDSTGATLNGANKYVVRFAKEPPVGAFWSLTMYNAGDKMLVENPIHRYKVGTDTQGLKREANGTLVVSIQADQPTDGTNWLPTPKGDFYVILRMYQPSDEIRTASGGVGHQEADRPTRIALRQHRVRRH